MQVHPHLQDQSSPFFQSAPKRSLSYNDLKRKRLIRSEKSKTKLNPQHSDKLILRTQKKKPSDNFAIALSSAPNTAQDIRKIQKSINQLKDVFQEINEKNNNKKYIISKPFYTDRVRPNNQDQRKISFIDKSTTTGNGKISLFYQSIDMAGNEKQLIKNIISKKKSQRRLLKFDEIRAQVKRSKSKSKLNQFEQETAPHSKIINQSSSQQVMQRSRSRKNNLRVNKFETVQEKPLIKYSQAKENSKEQLVNNYVAQNLSKKQAFELGEKSQYRSRRKLKIEDFRTQRRDIQLTKEGQKSEGKLKFHRRLKKTNSQIVIRTSQTTYNKSKYMTRVESKSTLNVRANSQRHQKSINKSSIISKSAKNQQFSVQIHQKPTQIIEQRAKQPQFISKQQADDQINLLRDLELSAINISEIQIKKEHSFTQIQNDLSLVNAIEAQQLQLKMKEFNPKKSQNCAKSTNQDFKDSKQSFKKCKKQTAQKSSLGKQENAENIENLSNLLDFISLPTEELKVKINRCSTKIVKKKNEMEKFKKIFPVNFFNQ